MGAPATPSGSRAAHETPAGSHPSGFDPSRGGQRREEAKALLPFFTENWEPLRVVLQRAGENRSASQMVSRARELEASGAIESRWENAMKVWRKADGAGEAQDDWLARISAEQNRLRLLWLANAVLACDYGDNESGQIGWRIRADLLGGEALMFGPTINSAIDNAIAMETRQGGDAQQAPSRSDDSAGPKDIAQEEQR